MSEQAEDDDRTEEPTQRKLDEAFRKGDVPKSQELNTLFVLGGLALCIAILGGPMGAGFMDEMRGFLMNAHQVPSDGAGFYIVARNMLIGMLSVLALPFIFIMFAGLAGGAIQHRPLWTVDPLQPKLERISLISGAKRLFGMEALVNFAKGLLKILIVGVLAGVILWRERDTLDLLVQVEPQMIPQAAQSGAIKMLLGILVLFFFVAVADLMYQRMRWFKKQRMTRKELRDEYKQTEGNPEVKAKMKQTRMARLRGRMMASVPDATVIITNPTHYAVALKYEQGMQAPICVAKGVDHLALRIRKVANENAIPIVENPPLARALHASVEIEDEIPVEHYKAVAEVIGYVLRLRRIRA
ncbi:flagellar biosynthesis protein FlhB [Saliniramus sp.]|uniref:flagellar biosynthesis protein FlhB n=1 Tax=Saliniramus sp. TaxID=2986772 RepID=UPI002CBDF787|nr:flagellar biosynthesis protein FlhB [Saliniramus sp.]HMB11248.1 flagellar biosynthesis protein FlhB [Saliniramus sp.]